MAKLIPFSFAALMFIIVLHLATPPTAHADPSVLVGNCNSTDGNYTTTSTYKTNLDSLFSKTITTNLDSGFYNFSSGQSPNTANLISLCLGNVNVTGCHACQKSVIDSIKRLCPNQKTAIAWSDDCFVRYSKHDIFGVLAENPAFLMWNTQKAKDNVLEEYVGVVKTLLEGLPRNASAGDSRIKFASAQADFNSSVTIYAAAQCTPDLSQDECLSCVRDANKDIQSCKGCKGQRGARLLLPSCMVRFEEYKFYMSSDAPVPSMSPSPSPSPLAPVPSTSPSPSLAPVPSTSPTPGVEPVPPTSPSPSLEHVPTASPPSPGGPSGDTTTNAAGKERRKSSIFATVVVGACLSALM